MHPPVSRHLGCQQLSVILHHDGFRGLLRPGANARCADFNVDFMHVESEHAFAPGEHVIIDLGLDGLCVEELEGVIFDAIPQPHGFSYRVEFLYRNRRKTHSAEILRCLRLMEDHIKQAAA